MYKNLCASATSPARNHCTAKTPLKAISTRPSSACSSIIKSSCEPSVSTRTKACRDWLHPRVNLLNTSDTSHVGSGQRHFYCRVEPSLPQRGRQRGYRGYSQIRSHPAPGSYRPHTAQGSCVGLALGSIGPHWGRCVPLCASNPCRVEPVL